MTEFSFNIISRHSDVSIKGPDDLLISANVDEIMSRRALSKLKQCQTSDDVISAALWMPIGKLDRAFKSDYPVLGRNHTFGVPTIYKVSTWTNTEIINWLRPYRGPISPPFSFQISENV